MAPPARRHLPKPVMAPRPQHRLPKAKAMRLKPRPPRKRTLQRRLQLPRLRLRLRNPPRRPPKHGEPAEAAPAGETVLTFLGYSLDKAVGA